MAKEIERKFAVVDLSVIEGRMGLRILQGYVANQPMTVRVRVIEAEAFMTLKSKTVGIERDEYEFPVPMHHAQELLDCYCGRRIIEKTRYRIPHGAVTFEVDVFSGRHQGLVVAEVELDHADQEFDLPEWIGPELTGDKRYSNGWLALADAPPESDDAKHQRESSSPPSTPEGHDLRSRRRRMRRTNHRHGRAR